jgi:hypothetical protein
MATAGQDPLAHQRGARGGRRGAVGRGGVVVGASAPAPREAAGMGIGGGVACAGSNGQAEAHA